MSAAEAGGDAESAADRRAQGNAAFSNKKFIEAVNHYSFAIDILEQLDQAAHADALSKLHANRAACYIKLEEHGAAVQDATTSIQFDPAYAKVRTCNSSWRLPACRTPAAVANAVAAAERLATPAATPPYPHSLPLAQPAPAAIFLCPLQAYYRRGDANFMMGRFKEALKDLRMVSAEGAADRAAERAAEGAEGDAGRAVAVWTCIERSSTRRSISSAQQRQHWQLQHWVVATRCRSPPEPPRQRAHQQSC